MGGEVVGGRRPAWPPRRRNRGRQALLSTETAMRAVPARVQQRYLADGDDPWAAAW